MYFNDSYLYVLAASRGLFGLAGEGFAHSPGNFWGPIREKEAQKLGAGGVISYPWPI